MMALRKCWKYVPTECTLADIKKGDFYQMDRADETDVDFDPGQLFYAVKDAQPKPNGEPGSVVESARFIEDPTYAAEA